MQPPLFYQPEIQNDNFHLKEEESKHCIRVLRLKTGDEIKVTDGFGNLYRTVILDPNPKKTVLHVKETIHVAPDRDYRIHMAVSPTKNINRFEWFLEKATEIGIDEVTPLFCQNSERTVIKTERLQKVIIAAMKQSFKYRMPKLNEPENFSDFIRKTTIPAAFIAYCDEKEKSLVEAYKRNSDVLILIGPEGDFTPNEIKTAEKASIKPVHLGKSRLRTETAALIACHTIHVLNTLR